MLLRIAVVAVCAALVLAASLPLSADRESGTQALEQTIEELKAQVTDVKSQYEGRIGELEQRIEALEAQLAQAQVEGEVPEVETAPAVAYGGAVQSFNPDISVIGDFVGHITDADSEHNEDGFFLREAELAFGADVDPFSRADLFIGIHRHIEHEEEGESGHAHDYELHLEEGYLTWFMPGRNQAKIGKFKTKMGKVNTMHTHSLSWVDYPLVVSEFLGEEGWAGTGLSFSRLLSDSRFVEATLEIVNNEQSPLFAGEDWNDLTYIGHLTNFFDLTDESSLEWGLSAAYGPNSADGLHKTWIYGTDLTYKWRPFEQGLYRSTVARLEALWSRHRSDEGRQNAWGMFASLDHQLNRHWTVGARYDYSQLPLDPEHSENAYSFGATYAQSEFAFWRLEWRHTNRGYERDSNELWLQCNFGVGPHRAHQY
jgi:hypothetical protein